MFRSVPSEGVEEVKKTTALRKLLQSQAFLVVPGCFNALSARLIEQAGFQAIYISGAGLGGVQIEDQVTPKKCGHTEGKQIISKEEMVRKIKAAVNTRKDPEFLLIARTDAIDVTGLEDALERAAAYREAGADVLFVEAPRTKEEMQRITQTVKAFHLANMGEGGGKTPILPPQELEAMGYKMAIYPVSTWMASIKAIQEVLAILKEDGTTTRYASRMVSFQEMFEVVGRSKFLELEKKYTA